MTTTKDHLARLLAFHENAAAHIRATLALLNGIGPTGFGGDRKSATYEALTSGNGLSTVAKQALALDAQRQAVKNGPRPRGTKIHDQRQRTATYLQLYDPKEPKLPGEFKEFRGLGSLIHRGYLQRKGPGYIRTSKPYFVNREDRIATTK